MQFKLDTSVSGLTAYLPYFLALAGGDRWRRRCVQLAQSSITSGFQTKIVADYHWLELALSEQMIMREQFGRLAPERWSLQDLAAMYFAGMVVEVYGRLTTTGRTTLQGRVRAAMKAETGFAALYLEMDTALRLLGDGFDVDFPDLEGTGHHDISFARGEIVGEVECKSLSADAGRKIHRKDFYRFMDTIGSLLGECVVAGAREVLLITLRDRLPSDFDKQTELRSAVVGVLTTGGPDTVEGAFFTVRRENYSSIADAVSLSNGQDFYQSCKELFGGNCHVAGLTTEGSGCVVVMRSDLEDDTSRPLLEGMKKAATQFSGGRPSFIAVQFNDIAPADLVLTHLRRRAGLLSYAVFLEINQPHVAATYFCTYGGLAATPEGIGAPAFAIPNPKPKFVVQPSDYSALLGGLPDVEFARLVGAPPLTESISYIPFEPISI